MDLGSYMTPAQTNSTAAITTLVDTMSTILTGGNMLASSKSSIVSFVANTTNFPLSATPTNSQMRDRVRAIVQLIVVSPEFAIQK